MESLRKNHKGRLIEPGDSMYDQARRVWNGSINRYPGLVAQCADTGDVASVVRFARERNLVLAVRGGGHNIAGSGTCDGGIVIDLSQLKEVQVDPAARMATVQPGLRWGELDAATQAHGLAVPGGIVSTTGVAGFTLGGGIGWLHRPFGLTIDSLVSAEVVTATGEVVQASEQSHPDLFWGLRGGGGNFGVVTSFAFRAHQLGPELMAGAIFYPAEHLAKVVAGYREIMATAPDELTLFFVMRRAPAAPFLPEAVHGKPVVAIAGCYAGPLAEGERVLAALAELAPPIANVIRPQPYAQFQSMFDGSWTEGFGNYWKAEYLSGIPDEVVPVLAEHLESITSGLSDFKIVVLGGAASRVPADATAFAYRHVPFVLNINSRWSLPGEAAPHTAWTQHLWEAMRPFSAGGVYVNFVGEEGADRVRAAYGEQTYQRLVSVKNAYDPGNLFRLNQNIKPG